MISRTLFEIFTKVNKNLLKLQFEFIYFIIGIRYSHFLPLVYRKYKFFKSFLLEFWKNFELWKILFSLHTAKGNAISGLDAKQQKWSVPLLIDATTISTSMWHFSYAEHGKLTIEVGIWTFPNFRVTSRY